MHPPLLQTIQVTLLTLHEHIGSSPIITDYTSNTAYPSRTHWFFPIITDYKVTLLTLHEHIGSSPILQTIQVTLHTLHEHIDSSPIITDYTSNTAYPSRTHWVIPHYYRLYK